MYYFNPKTCYYGFSDGMLHTHNYTETFTVLFCGLNCCEQISLLLDMWRFSQICCIPQLMVGILSQLIKRFTVCRFFFTASLKKSSHVFIKKKKEEHEGHFERNQAWISWLYILWYISHISAKSSINYFYKLIEEIINGALYP